MQANYALSDETLGYVTQEDKSNTDTRYLVSPSVNALIDANKKARIRPGYTRLGAASPADTYTEIRNAWTWNTSTGSQLPQRFYDDELEVYLTSVDGTDVDAWTRVSNGWSTTEKLRAATWFDAAENLDLQIMVQGDDNLYEWGGGVAIVSSVTATAITKTSTTTFVENRFYSTRNQVVTCVRTGTDYTYTSGEDTTTIEVGDTTGLIAGDILVQKILTTADKPAANRKSHFIHCHENQIALGSKDDEKLYLSKNTSYTDFTFSSPRASGEGALLTLTDPVRAIATLGKFLLAFAGPSTIFRTEFEQLSVGASVVETLNIRKLDVGVNQGALCQEAVRSIGNSLAYLSNEVALRFITNPEDITGIDPKTFSNPIKPNFDAETWDPENTFMEWYKNILLISAGETGHTYMLNFIEDADGRLRRFWNPPQNLPVGPMSIFDAGDGELLYGHSNAVPESYLLFDGASDGQYENMDVADKLPIPYVIAFSYNNYKKPAALKNLDEWYVEGEITPNTKTTLQLNYDYEGATSQIFEEIDGSDDTILEGLVATHDLGDSSIAQNPQGGLLNTPTTARRFRTVFEEAREDFHEIQDIYSGNDVDQYFAVTRRGGNVVLSRRRDTSIMH